MDHVFLQGRRARWGELDRRPSEIFRDHFLVAPYPEENVDRVLEAVGTKAIVFGSDFPHAEGLAYPREYAVAQLGHLAPDQTRAIMADNLAGFLGVSVKDARPAKWLTPGASPSEDSNVPLAPLVGSFRRKTGEHAMPYKVEPIPDSARDAPELEKWLNDEADQMMTLVSLDLQHGVAVFEALDNPSPI
jgi:hypothetical protein